MSIINNFLLILIALAFIGLTAGFVFVFSKNVRQGRVFREKLARRVESLRMSKLLQALGVDLSSYLHNTPVSEINRNAETCEQCTVVDSCDSTLEKSALKAGEIGFCPNEQDFERSAGVNQHHQG